MKLVRVCTDGGVEYIRTVDLVTTWVEGYCRDRHDGCCDTRIQGLDVDHEVAIRHGTGV